jgi:hypothetical protein
MKTVSLINRRGSVVVVAWLAVFAGPSCTVHYVTRGADLYAGGYYVEAAEVFERTEARLATSSRDDRARYGLYRGATFLALGDSPSAERWLNYSEDQLRAESGALSDEERVMLERARQAVAKRRPAPPPPTEGPAVAATRALPVEARQP